MSRKLNWSKLENVGEHSIVKQLVDKELLQRDDKFKSVNVVTYGNLVCDPPKFVSIPSQKCTAIVSPKRRSDKDEKKHYKPGVTPATKKPIILKRDNVISATKNNYKQTVQNNFISKDVSHRSIIKLDRSKLKIWDTPDPLKQKRQTLPISANQIPKSKLVLKRKLSADSSPVKRRFYASTPKDQSENVLKQEIVPLTKQSKGILKNVVQSQNSQFDVGPKKISFNFKPVLSNFRNSVSKSSTSNKQPVHLKNKVTHSYQSQMKFEPMYIELNKNKNTRVVTVANTSVEALRKGVSSSTWVQVNNRPNSEHSSHLNTASKFQSNSTRVSNSKQSDYKSSSTKYVSFKEKTDPHLHCSLSSARSKDTQTHIPSAAKHQTPRAVSSNKTFENTIASASCESQNFQTVCHKFESPRAEEHVAGPLRITTRLQTPSNVLHAKSPSTWQDMSLKTNRSTSSIPDPSQNSEEQSISEDSDVAMMDVSENLQSLDILNSTIEVDSLGSNRKSYVFVIDTNVLIHDLNFIDELKDTPLEGCGPPYIYIPWIVICELDRLKMEKNKNKLKIQQAVRFVFFMFNSKHPRIKGQTAQHSNNLSRCFGTSGDDVLLSYCSWFTEKISKDKVCLLTNDKNLCNKAFMNEIKVSTPETLYENIKPDVSVVRERMLSKDKVCLLTNDKNLCNKAFMNEIKVSTPETLYENIKPDVSVVRERMEDSDPLCQFNNSVNETNVKVLKEKMHVDVIICEAKRILKNILEPFLIESMNAAFGESSKTFLTPPPSCLLDIFELYKKYWVSVFGIMLDRTVKQKIETLLRLFSFTRGFFCSTDDAFAALIAIEYICKAIMRRNPNIRPSVNRISRLTDKCKALFKTEDSKVDVAEKSGNEVVRAVFDHIWKLINHLCGMILDFAQMPHDLVYKKPEEMPSLIEFELLIPKLFPAMQLIKQSMLEIIDSIESAEPGKAELEYKRLYDYLFQFVPSLGIPAEPPATEHFTVQRLKAFCNDPKYREHFKARVQQLRDHQKLLIDCLRMKLWKS